MNKKFWLIYLALLSLGLLSGSASAQTPKTPDIPAALVAKTFKAQAQMADAQLQAERAQATLQQKTQAMQQLLAELQSTCGEKFVPQLNPAGDPVCAAKPVEKPAPKPETPAKK